MARSHAGTGIRNARGPLFGDDVVVGLLGAELLAGERTHNAPPRVVALDLGDGRGEHDLVCRHPPPSGGPRRGSAARR